MNRLEARTRGLPWTDFKDIPLTLRRIYDLILALDPVAGKVVSQTNSYEQCCEYWLNNSLIKALTKETDNDT